MKFFICVLFFLSISAMAEAVLSEEAWEKNLTYFYLSPTQTAFNALQQPGFSLDSILTEKNKVSLATLFARISEKYDWPLENSTLGRIASEMLDKKSALSAFVNDDDQVNPRKLDVWWSSFFATGEESYLEKIFDFVVEDAKDAEQLDTNASATWSFASNMGQHVAVKKFSQKKLNEGNLNTVKANFLRERIQKLERDKEDRLYHGLIQPDKKGFFPDLAVLWLYITSAFNRSKL